MQKIPTALYTYFHLCFIFGTPSFQFIVVSINVSKSFKSIFVQRHLYSRKTEDLLPSETMIPLWTMLFLRHQQCHTGCDQCGRHFRAFKPTRASSDNRSFALYDNSTIATTLYFSEFNSCYTRKLKTLFFHQGGKSWQPFGERKNGHKISVRRVWGRAHIT